MRLWELGNELEVIAVMITENGGELSPALEERLAKIEGEFEGKAERTALMVRQMEAHATAAEEEEKRLKAIKKSYAAGAKSLKAYLLRQMQRQEVGRIETSRVRLRIQRNSQPSMRLVAEEWPEEWTKTVTTTQEDREGVLRAWTATNGDPYAREAPDGFEIEWNHHIRIT